MENLRKKITEAVAFIRTKTQLVPDIGIILGTGLGLLGEGIDVIQSVGYEHIPHFPISTVESHAGRFLFGHLGDKKVVAMQGRFHYYEGYTMAQVTFPVRVMKQLGIRILIVSNACGGLNPQFQRGDIMAITDHINLQGANPLVGPNDDSLGPRFPDMCHCYDPELIGLAAEVAREKKVALKRGVYVSVAGPNLETAAEYRFLRFCGADVVGMSTVPEVIVARHQGTRVAGFSIITDMGLPDALQPTSLEEIIAVANRAEPNLRDLINGLIEKITV